ncbi:Alpha/beta hydrolase [Micromonospora echinofusca]|uniref:Alpha/beta hydrolase n=1 Tax=Micromonospora echinofusca TaxID=47858 RepID=A0A1C5G521_MICEH|nr:alpha/beta hydrolase [Micromonospora echinofusca]SCG14176.1 Alpha/beta hydrolase [Micromonospora echinofusca]
MTAPAPPASGPAARASAPAARAGHPAHPARPDPPAPPTPPTRPAHPADRAAVVGHRAADVSYRQLWAADPDAWRAAGAAWRGLTEPVAHRAGELAAGAAVLRGGWSGGAADAADARLAALRGELTAVRPALIEADQVLAEFAARLGVAKARLAAAVAHAEAAGLLVDRQGRVTAGPARAPATARPGTGRTDTGAAGAGGSSAGGTGAGVSGGSGSGGAGGSGTGPAGAGAAIRAALELAGAADREAAARLGALADGARVAWADVPPPGRPAPGADPATVRAWWAGLTPAQRRWLVAYEPGLVGRLDGVPVAARDQANRLLLGARREELLAARRRLLERVPRGPVELAGLARVGKSLAGLDALAARLAGDEQPRAYLLGLGTAGEGRAVVALGNPDRSARVLTYVPGMTAGLHDVPGELGRAARVLSRCGALDSGQEAAAVLWLDYDAPDFLHEAAWPGQARDAGPALHRFQEGLRATHDDPPGRQTVLGHSYGSLVVGTAARDHGLAADALVFVGSPGVGVAHAGELGLPPGQVWASTAPDDVIRWARSPDELARRALLGASPVGPAIGALLGAPERELWFGQDPSHPGFGGRTFPSGRHGHTGYWEAGNPALDGMARVVLGR